MSSRWGLALEGEIPPSPAVSAVTGVGPLAAYPHHARRNAAAPPRPPSGSASRLPDRARPATAAPRRRPQRRSRSAAGDDTDGVELPATAAPALARWEHEAVSLYRNVRHFTRDPPLVLSPALFLFSVLRGVPPNATPAALLGNGPDVPKDDQQRVDAAFLLSFFLQTSVLTASTVASSARECAAWLLRNVTAGGPTTVSRAPQRSAFLATVVTALHASGRLGDAGLIAQWLLEVFLCLISTPESVPASLSGLGNTRVPRRNVEWSLAQVVSDCAYHLQQASPASRPGAGGAALGDPSPWAAMSTELYVCVLQRIGEAWHGVTGTVRLDGATAEVDPVTAMLKLGVLVREHPNFHAPAAVGALSNVESDADSPTAAVAVPTDRLVVIRETWQAVLHQAVADAQFTRRGPIASVVTLSYLLSD